jgi:hypothetical protein
MSGFATQPWIDIGAVVVRVNAERRESVKFREDFGEPSELEGIKEALESWKVS